MNTYCNPILSGFHPDPTICRVDNDYYLATSTFHFFPGLPIFHSKNLVDWELIGHALHRPSQIPLTTAGYSGGLFAPTLRYHQGTFYIICTDVSGKGNFIITAKDPAGPWSDPVTIPNALGIDPSLFFDDDGRCYYTGNGFPEKPLYDGHCLIWCQELNLNTMQLVGEKHILVNGGTNLEDKPIWIEAPHTYKINGFYYLLAAEGGTGEWHSEVVFRSKSIFGPYESYTDNPILSNRRQNIDPNGPIPITCTGHADLVQTQYGEWWMVFLACRPYPPYEKCYYNTGRETFLIPVQWNNGWPVIRDGSSTAGYIYQKPVFQNDTALTGEIYNVNTFTDNFDTATLNKRWYMVRTSPDPWYSLTERPGYLRLKLRPEEINGSGNPSLLLMQQLHTSFIATTTLEVHFQHDYEAAGFAVIQNGTTYYLIEVSLKNNKPYVSLLEQPLREGPDPVIRSAIEIDVNRIYMRIVAKGRFYSFYFSIDSSNWICLGKEMDGSILSTRHTGGFVGSFIGLYAVSHGVTSQNYADFDNYTYYGDNKISSISIQANNNLNDHINELIDI